MIHPNVLINLLSKKRLSLHNEKALQNEISKILSEEFPNSTIEKEFHFDEKNIIDFRVDEYLGIEVKIKSSARSLYNQCVRYCQFDDIKNLLLITNVAMGFPSEINNKGCYFLNLSKGWL